jgi:hypothetical protein
LRNFLYRPSSHPWSSGALLSKFPEIRTCALGVGFF